MSRSRNPFLSPNQEETIRFLSDRRKELSSRIENKKNEIEQRPDKICHEKLFNELQHMQTEAISLDLSEMADRIALTTLLKQFESISIRLMKLQPPAPPTSPASPIPPLSRKNAMGLFHESSGSRSPPLLATENTQVFDPDGPNI